MRAWVVHQPGPATAGPLRLVDRAVPEPGRGELLIRALCCGVCRTDLHLAEGDLPPKHPDLTPGHEVVGEVVEARVPRRDPVGPGDRVGVAWLAGTDGSCRYPRRGRENLCPASTYTGWDIPGGYAEYLVAADAYVHRLLSGFTDPVAGPAAVRRDHRVPGAGLGAGAAGRHAGPVGLRWLGPPDRAGGHGPGRGRARVHPGWKAARELALGLGAASAQDSVDLNF